MPGMILQLLHVLSFVSQYVSVCQMPWPGMYPCISFNLYPPSMCVRCLVWMILQLRLHFLRLWLCARYLSRMILQLCFLLPLSLCLFARYPSLSRMIFPQTGLPTGLPTGLLWGVLTLKEAWSDGSPRCPGWMILPCVLYVFNPRLLNFMPWLDVYICVCCFFPIPFPLIHTLSMVRLSPVWGPQWLNSLLRYGEIVLFTKQILICEGSCSLQ